MRMTGASIVGWRGRDARGRGAGERRGHVSLGAWVILALAVVSSVVVVAWPVPKREGMEMWTFSRSHAGMYESFLKEYNAGVGKGVGTATSPVAKEKVNMFVLSGDALQRRMMSGFLSQTPMADVIEIERSMVTRAFSGPLEDVGFVDLTDRLKAEGIYAELNEPSFSPWTSRGRIFGLPHDVHPLMLAYRADIVEEAGIDMSKIETWDDFVRELRPLIKDKDGDGRPDRYILNIWHTSLDHVEALLLQAGGGYFDANDRPVMDNEINAKVISTVVSWVAGPGRIAADAPEFSASGNQLRLEGFVVCSIMPDWLAGVWENDLPQLKGKLKLIPLPAWEKGGRRTSVWGGTMIGISKTSPKQEEAWAFAKKLYLDEGVARRLYISNKIISPAKKWWAKDFYDAPDPYFCGQAPGRLYIALAPDVPRRTSSPFNPLAKQRVQDALIALREHAIATKTYDVEGLMPEARRLLLETRKTIEREMNRNVFLKVDESKQAEGAD